MYSEEQVSAVLHRIGVKVSSDTYTNFLCFCPVHGNKYTPSLSVDKATGSFICFNPACGVDGNLERLVKLTVGGNPFTIIRLIDKAKSDTEADTELQLRKILETPTALVPFDSEFIDYLAVQFWEHPEAVAYMEGRGFSESILRAFNIGYDATKNMVTVPMHSFRAVPIGFIGRTASSTDKQFKNTKKLPRRHTLFNIHRALKAGETVIVVESAFDCMMLTQAGFPNCVAILGGAYSDEHESQLKRYFSRIIVMTDDDHDNLIRYSNCRRCVREQKLEYCAGHNPGRALGRKIATSLKGKEVLWAVYDANTIYPHDAKDVSDMTVAEIKQCVNGAISQFEYDNMGIDTHE